MLDHEAGQVVEIDQRRGNGRALGFVPCLLREPARAGVEPSGFYTGLAFDVNIGFFGQIHGDSLADFSWIAGADTLGPVTLFKVMDPTACEGDWTGSFTPDPPGASDVGLQIDPSGTVTGASGLAGPVAGRMFYDSGILVGHLHTGETVDGWGQIGMSGDMIGGHLVGDFGRDCDVCGYGTFDLLSAALSSPETIRNATWSRAKANYRPPIGASP